MALPNATLGLSDDEAARRQAQFGPNAMPEVPRRPWRDFLKHLWGPVPWMLELAIVLELVLGQPVEAAVIAGLTLLNAGFSVWQEQRSSDALAILRQRLRLTARVHRDDAWQTRPADQLVPGDVIHIRMGDLLPADVQLLDGDLQLDQSALTGESLPVSITTGGAAYAGTVVVHGEATAAVTATGPRTRFGRTADLVRQANGVSQLEQVVFSVTRALVILDGLLALAVVIFAWLTQMPLLQILPFALIMLVASVPAALPATFAIATAFGAHELSGRGVLVTRLSAIEEAAGMDTLCSDKTGTITENRLSVAAWLPYKVSEPELVGLAAMASDPSTQDPLDLAILQQAQARQATPDFARRLRWVPFDSATKRSEAGFSHTDGVLQVTKGAPSVIAPLCAMAPATWQKDVEDLSAQGYRVLAVARGAEPLRQLVGLVAFQDPPRADSAALIEQLRGLGIRVLLVTGDGLATARAVARRVGIGDHACSTLDLQAGQAPDPACEVFGDVLPEHKFALVQSLQRRGHITGMTGDGVNDAPALKQAQVGIAVSNATDVAKASASLVLTRPGLGDMIAAIEVSRQIYQRMLTYTLNKVIKTIQVSAFLSLGLMFTGVLVTTPLLVVLLLFANDFVTMAIATDRVRASRKPDRWDIRAMLIPALILALPVWLLTFGVFLIGRYLLQLPLASLQTLSFITLVFTAQGMVYLVRERHACWSSRPSRWLLLASALAVTTVSGLASFGILMQAIPWTLILTTLAATALFLLALDGLKVWAFRIFNLH